MQFNKQAQQYLVRNELALFVNANITLYSLMCWTAQLIY